MVGNANANGIPFLKRYGIPPAIKNSMVLWYDIARQGATNESMAENPILKDLSGNGHDATCYNFAWSGMSGIGGYVFSRPLANWYKSSNNNGSYTIEGNVMHITKLDTTNNYYVNNNGDKTNTIVEITGNNYTTKPFKIKISGLPEGKSVRLGGLIANNTVTPTINVLYENKYFGNGEHIVESSSVVWDNEQLEVKVVNYPNIYIDSDTADDVDITIEILPEYPNALVSDGVDDYAYVEGLPILTDYTVIAKRKRLDIDLGNKGALASKLKNDGTFNGAFLFELIQANTGVKQVVSFGTFMNIQMVDTDISYMTKNSYNGSPIKSGQEPDNNHLTLFSTREYSGCAKAALYSFILFNRTLTEDEIKKWIRINIDKYYLLPSEVN